MRYRELGDEEKPQINDEYLTNNKKWVKLTVNHYATVKQIRDSVPLVKFRRQILKCDESEGVFDPSIYENFLDSLDID